MRNVTKLQINRIHGLLERDQTKEDDVEKVGRPTCPKVVDEEKNIQKKGLQEESEDDENDSEDTEVNYPRSNVERAEAEVT